MRQVMQIAMLALVLVFIGCAKKQRPAAPLLGSESEAAPARTEAGPAEPVAEESSQAEAAEGEIDLGFEGGYGNVDVEAGQGDAPSPQTGTAEAAPAESGGRKLPTEFSCKSVADCEKAGAGAPGKWSCDGGKCSIEVSERQAEQMQQFMKRFGQ